MRKSRKPLLAKKILVIEDDRDFQVLLSVFLSDKGFVVESADGGGTGIKKALCSRPDLVLLDNELGDMNGHDVAFWLEHMNGTRNIPVILLSVLAGDSEIAGEIKQYPSCRDIISKASPLTEILERIRLVLGVSGR